MRKTYRIPQLICILLSLMLCALYFLPMLTFSDELKAAIDRSENGREAFYNSTYRDIMRSAGFSAYSDGDDAEAILGDATVDSLANLSYFELATFCTRALNADSSIESIVRILAIVLLWLPLAFAVFMLFWCLCSNSVMAFLNCLVSCALSIGLVFLYAAMNDRHVFDAQNGYVLGKLWALYAHQILNALLFIMIIIFMSSKHGYRVRKAKKRASKAKRK